MPPDDESIARVPVRRIAVPPASAETGPAADALAVEEPLEIRIGWGRVDQRMHRSLSITMRTPGDDHALAAGFLLTEGIVDAAEHIAGIDYCGPPAPGRATSNVVRAELSPELDVDIGRLQRNFYVSSSCGICGKASLDAVEVLGRPPARPDRPRVTPEVIVGLSQRLRAAQRIFDATGGLHAAALFEPDGQLRAVAEDVGRHNAVDKLVGARLLAGEVPLDGCIMMVSGRTSFEIVQKAHVAGVPVLVGVSAPSSLAVSLAERATMTLIGFARDGRFNVYSGAARVGYTDT